jgi:amino acid adenylation domain-containing protein
VEQLTAFISRLRAEGTQLWVNDGRLCYRSASRRPDPARAAQLRARRAELIDFLEQPPTTSSTPLADQPRLALLPLSLAQEGLWFLEQLAMTGPAYNVRTMARIEGALDLVALRRALHELETRHEVLRTRYRTADGVGTQVIDPPAPGAAGLVDLSALAPPERARRTSEILHSHAQRRFDLEREAPFAIEILRLTSTEHLLLMTMHHIMIDGPSMAILLGELGTLYGAYAAGSPSPLPEPRAQYADYAIWQRTWLLGDVLDRHIEYWRARLAGAPPTIDLPFDRPRPQEATFDGDVVEFCLPPGIQAAVAAFARERQATPFSVLLSAFTALLARLSAQQDVSIGLPVEARAHRDAEQLVGYFTNMVVLRADLSSSPTFDELLQQVRTRLLEALEHRDAPFERVVAELRPDRRLSVQPLFQVAFTYLEQQDLFLPGLEVTRIEPDDRTAKFDLSLCMSETAEGLQGGLEFSSSVFDRSTVQRFVESFVVLLEGLVGCPGERVGGVSLLGEVERRRLLVEFNATAVAVAGVDRCVHEVFERRVACSPDAVALECGGERLSYAQLNARANELARGLRALGVGPEVLVAVCVARSVEMVVGLLAILKAGGAYVPLDPSYPRERLGFMLADSGARVVLTQQRLVGVLGTEHDAEVVCLDGDWPVIEGDDDANVSGGARPLNMAYCIYTSGSSGRPKGVGCQHASAVAFVDWAVGTFGDEALARVLFSTSICFDLSIFELFAALACGGCVVLVDDALALGESAAGHAPTLINTVPSAAQALLDADAIDPATRVINLAGEPLREELVRGLSAVAPDARVFNLYGPTEYTTYATYCRVDDTPTVTIGRPLANTQAYVLDEASQPVPIGVPGEIHLAGVGLARGYWQQPRLTAEKFVPNPFGAPGTRMYRTGDLGRYSADGKLEFRGRVDHQVKIRGYRIELAEIETALLTHAAVIDAVVVAREDTPGARRLVAYVVTPNDPQPTLAEHLRQTLPDYMIPAVFITLDALPRHPNGKLDRNTLRAPEDLDIDHNARYLAPRTPTEGLLAEIWSDVLNIERVGIHDNFFALGGHSLLATQVVARIRHSMRCELPLRDLFAAPTIAQLTTHLSTAQSTTQHPITPNTTRPATASFAQQRMWFLDQLQPHSSLYNMPGAWEIRGVVDEAALQRALDEVVRRHESLRTTFEVVAGSPVQIVAERLLVPLTIVHPQVDAGDAEIERIIQLEGGRSFDLAQGPLIRAGLVRIGDGRAIILLTLHHAIADGWSIDVLVDELCTLYEAYRKGEASPLPDLQIQYSDFACWQRERLQGDVLEEQLQYWLRYLEGAPACLELPTDRPRPSAMSYRGAWMGFELGEEVAEGLRAINRRCESTLFMTVAAAFAVVLHRHSGQDDICIGYPVANRGRAEIEGLIGLFVNTLVLRARFASQTTFAALVADVRGSVLDAAAHQELPFEKLVEELNPRRDPSRQPLVQVALSTLEQSDLRLPGVELTRVQPFDRLSKFDLTLFVTSARDGFSGGFEYSTDLFDPATMQRLTGHLATVLRAVTADPGLCVDELPLLSGDERRRLVIECNDTATAIKDRGCVHELVAERAAERPGALAVADAGDSLTYAELNARANQLAHHLRSLGVGPERRVAICVERSSAMIVGLLGILKAGGAYVPLDPRFPTVRSRQMLTDSAATLLLTSAELKDALACDGIAAVCLDADWPAIEREPVTDPVVATRPANLAYTIYTSGSTGRPKGVDVAHAGLLNLVAWHRRRYEMTPADRTTQVAAPAFDACTWEVWAAVTAGASLHVMDEDVRLDPREIAGWLAREAITLCFLPTPLAEAALAEPWPSEMALRALLTGGDTLHRGAPEGATFCLVNHYGPTESSVVATCGVVDAPASAFRRPPIGTPIDNTQVYILDEHGEPAPAGVVGHLHIGGAGLARGYAGRPQITAQAFVPDPLGAEPGARIYRTGDLARYGPDGEIELTGRLDEQVKLRGFRVELREVEATLMDHPDIRACAVVAVAGSSATTELVAYVVAEAPAEGAQAWRQHLRDRLPEPMVPAAFVALDALPTTPNGKVDRAALRRTGRAGGHTDRAYVAPRTEVERSLAEIWQDLLRLDRAGAHDDFFACGGQSLLAVSALARVRDALGVDVRVSTFFDAPTIAGLAEHIETLRWLAHGPPSAAEAELRHGAPGEI